MSESQSSATAFSWGGLVSDSTMHPPRGPRPATDPPPPPPPSAAEGSQAAPYPSLGLTMRFRVVVDSLDLGLWKSCKGLAVTFKHRILNEGGNYDSPAAFLPETIEYQAITLERAISSESENAVQNWLKHVSGLWFKNPAAPFRGSTASIELGDASNISIYRWNLRGVYPTKWTGPQLDAMSGGGVATETLELIHQGFL